MTFLKKIQKHYEFNSSSLKKIEQITAYKNNENASAGLSKISEKSIVEDSIDLLHSSIFGKDVFDQTMNKLENVLGNLLTNVLNEYAARFSNSLENIYMQNEETKEMLLLILKANDILPESQNDINALLMSNDTLEDYIKEAVLFKKEFMK